MSFPETTLVVSTKVDRYVPVADADYTHIPYQLWGQVLPQPGSKRPLGAQSGHYSTFTIRYSWFQNEKLATIILLEYWNMLFARYLLSTVALLIVCYLVYILNTDGFEGTVFVATMFGLFLFALVWPRKEGDKDNSTSCTQCGAQNVYTSVMPEDDLGSDNEPFIYFQCCKCGHTWDPFSTISMELYSKE